MTQTQNQENTKLLPAKPQDVTNRELAIFTTVERIKAKNSFRWISALGNMFTTGYLEFPGAGFGYGPWVLFEISRVAQKKQTGQASSASLSRSSSASSSR